MGHLLTMPTPEFTKHIELRHKHSSSQIEATGYDPVSRTMRVRFQGKIMPVWDYTCVTSVEYEQFLAAASKGSYFTRKIRPHKTGRPVPLSKHQST